MKRDERGRRNRPPALPLRGIFSPFLRRENFCQKILKKLLTFPPALRIIAPVLARGRNKKQKIAGLCKGSTTDSDSVCEGSNPSPAAKTKGNCESSCLLFWVPAARGRPPPFGIRMLRAAKPPFCNALCTKETPAIDRRLFMFFRAGSPGEAGNREARLFRHDLKCRSRNFRTDVL